MNENRAEMAESAGESSDLGDPRLYRDDSWRPAFARLRRDDPVHFHPDSPYGPYWSVTRYADIMKVELDHATYSSSYSSTAGVWLLNMPVTTQSGSTLPSGWRTSTNVTSRCCPWRVAR